MNAPPLAPELWNCGAVALVVGLCCWSVRLLRLGHQLVDMRLAARQEATVHLRDLGPSLSVLRGASMWHLQQLVRTKKEAATADMPRIRMPFEVPPASLRLGRSVDERGHVRMTFSVDVAAAGPCAVQVFWNVRIDALERSHHRQRAFSGDGSAARKTRMLELPRSVFRRLGMADSIRANRALPWPLTPVRRQERRHRLDDDQEAESPADADSATLGRLLVGPGAFSSQSPMQIFDGGSCAFTAHVPTDMFLAPHEVEEASLAAETERDDAPASRAFADSEPRYGAVVIVGVPTLLSDGAGSPRAALPWRTRSLWRGRSAEAAEEEEEAVCECVAVDFLPTPARADKFVPSVVKRLVFTPSRVYILQDIFGRDASAGGECVICLEGAPSAVLLPCRHQCVCRVCLEEIDRCPICRAAFASYVCLTEATPAAVAAAASQQLQVKLVDSL